MEESIKAILKDLEKKHNITILFAAETGSRNWGLNAADSDYDIHFVFYRPLKEYITLNKMSDIITVGYDKDLNERKKEGSFIEISGFDIYKYSKLLLNSNLSAIEWVNSRIMYIENNNIELKTYINKNFNKMSVVRQYVASANSGYIGHISGKEISYKKYLHTMRQALNVEYVIKYNKLPPNIMTQTLEVMKNDIPPEVYQNIQELIRIKMQGCGYNKVKVIPALDRYYEHIVNKFKYFSCETKKRDINFFNKFLQNLLIKNEK